MLAIATEANTTFSADKIAKAMANMGERSRERGGERRG